MMTATSSPHPWALARLRSTPENIASGRFRQTFKDKQNNPRMSDQTAIV
jgi:hypothetical protein